MFLLRLILVASLFPLYTSAGSLTGVNAGVTPYACTDTGAQYLLAYDSHPKRQGWGAFGGGPKGDETARQTALRELYEETNCVFDEETLRTLKLKGPSKSGRFYSYVAEVPFFQLTDISAPRTCRDVERSQWIWIPHESLIDGLNRADSSPVIVIPGQQEFRFPLWRGAAKSLRNSLADGFLTLSDPCPRSDF